MEINLPQSFQRNDTSPVKKISVTEHSLASNEATRPVASEERIQTLDMIRGFALLGILLMNILGFGIDGSVFSSVITGMQNNADFRTLQAIGVMFDGTMRGLFSMLFGAGMILFTLNKYQIPGGIPVVEYYYRRLLWLVLFGVINAYIALVW
ncbi:MAG: hypothetical protein WKF89_15560 [Chitinophagaceae bacterium]